AECIELIIKNRNNIANALKNLNYEYVVLDLEGYSK
ncbi:MAG: lactate racemization operon protein LarE, partial [Candidatus Altiarchaeales archaeon HGW-Altiarchaeales-2]